MVTRSEWTATYFETPAEMRAWFKRHHASESELWVGFYKRGSGRPSITWPESVDEALCFGWIDGLRQGIDDQRYRIRFTPRKARSIWSTVNVRRAEEMIRQKRMTAAGRKAFEAREENRVGRYAYEQRSADLPKELEKPLKADRAAWAHWIAQPPSYRKAVCWWLLSAKKEETRERRLAKLIACSAAGELLPQYSKWR